MGVKPAVSGNLALAAGIAGAALMAQGCFVASFESLAAEIETVREDFLVGNWRVVDGVFGSRPDAVVQVREVDSGYRWEELTHLGSAPAKAYELKLFRIGERVFSELKIDNAAIRDGEPAAVFVLGWLEKGRNAFRVRPIDTAWARERLGCEAQNPFALLVAPPDEVIALLRDATETAFSEADESGVHYVRVAGDANDTST